ncbi:hypothetical protein DFP74_3020 [Nocardiopsis sp. Huas11]|uniref:hypothetical protein n=1 Tax=Nocardiopsis sp. Huas11 TaxID=2183912 RepID=UPI000EB31028|nr:hypothetical protein [Nocardiopsis sp. Huas11]RKS07353.1 hypothetical protein DFP74_3020 [Nocardiopsis sp. Huas11]
MVLTGRGWLVITSRAACGDRVVLARLLLLSGLLVVAWLAGGFGAAHGGTTSDSGRLVDSVLETGEATERAGQAAAEEIRAARLSDATANAAAVTGTLTGDVVPQAASLPATALNESGVTSALGETSTGTAANRVVDDATQVVDGTARGAGDLVDGITRTGHGVAGAADDSLRETGLATTVADGLTDSTRGVNEGIDGTAKTADAVVSGRLPDLGSEVEDAAESTGTARPAERGVSRSEMERVTRTARAAAGAAAHNAHHTAAEQAAERAADEAEDLGERIRLIGGGGTHHQGHADATGATAPTFPQPAAVGFLMARAAHLAPQAQRVALPGDPTLVVRDAADDPTFSPD